MSTPVVVVLLVERYPLEFLLIGTLLGNGLTYHDKENDN